MNISKGVAVAAGTPPETSATANDSDATGYAAELARSEAIAYQHVKDGCPYLDTMRLCPYGCDDDPSDFCI